MKVDIDNIWWLHNELRKIEEFSLEDLEFYIDGNKIDIDDDQIRNWKFTGLLNRDFVLSEQYKLSLSYKQLIRDNKIKEFLNG